MTPQIVTHNDADGIISAYLIQKTLGKCKVMFASPNSISKVLDLIKNKKQKIIILDISPNQEAIKKANLFKEVVWIDHHPQEQPVNTSEKIRLIHKQLPSTAAVIGQEYKINEKLIEIANQIDTNQVKSEDAEKLRDYVAYIRDTSQGILFKPLAKELIEKLDNLAFLNNPHTVLKIAAHKVQEKRKVDRIKFEEQEIRGDKIVFVESRGIATYEILKKVPKGDYIIILSPRNKGLKIEFRTNSKRDVLKLAQLFKGGGHLNAAGAFTENTNRSNVKKRIINFIKKKI